MTFRMITPGMMPIPGTAGSLLLFTDRDIVFAPNNRTHPIKIGGLVLPLQPLIEIRLNRNWVVNEIVGSAGNPDLSGSTVKENMGRSDAIITIDGFLLSTGSTMAQALNLEGGREDENKHWTDKLKQINSLFNEETSVEITDWVPAEDITYLPAGDIYHGWKVDPFSSGSRIKDMGVSVFEQLGIKEVVLLSFELYERAGIERRGYTIRLREDRGIAIDKLMPTQK